MISLAKWVNSYIFVMRTYIAMGKYVGLFFKIHSPRKTAKNTLQINFWIENDPTPVWKNNLPIWWAEASLKGRGTIWTRQSTWMEQWSSLGGSSGINSPPAFPSKETSSVVFGDTWDRVDKSFSAGFMR